MDDTYIIVTIDGRTYYIEADRVNDLAYINNKLVNVSNSQITMVNSFDTVTTYPRITCGSMAQCSFRASQQSTAIGVTSDIVLPDKFNMNTLQTTGILTYILFGLLLILGVKLLWKR